MKITYKRRPGFLRLFLPAFLTLLPMLMLGGGLANPVQAGVPTGGVSSKAQIEEVLAVRVYFRDTAERDRLATELGAEEIPTTLGYITTITDRPTYNDFIARGLRVEIDQKLSAVLSDPVQRDTFYGGYKTVEEMYTFLDQKVAAYPTLAQKVDIGDSWCKSHPGSCVRPQPNNGYDLFVLNISNQAIPGPKPVVWIDAGVHSREIATPEVAMRYIDYLLNNYNTNADARWIIDYTDIWIMPSFNPDGHHIVESPGEGTPYMYRKNGNNTAGTCAWPPTSSNHSGVDNNRNFPFLWGCCGGSTSSPCQQTYRGVAANSEDETAAVVAKIRTLIPDQRGPNNTDPSPLLATGLYQNLHTVVPVNLIPWGWTTSTSPNHTDLNNIAAHMAAPNANGTGYPGNSYPYGTISQELYIVDGGSIDWAYGELGAAAISTELSGGDFLPTFSCIDNPGCGSSQGIWPENRGMLLYQTKIARTPFLLTRGPDADTVSVSPSPVPQGTNATVTGRTNYQWSGNAYLQNVAAAEYYIDTPPWAGGTGVPMSAVDGSFNSPTEQVQGTIDTTGLSVGRHIVFIRGRGVNDYEGNQSWGPVSAAWLDVSAGGSVTPVTATSTVVPPTVTLTVVPPTLTSTIVPPTTTSTIVPPTVSSTVAPSVTGTVEASATAQASPTTACSIQFSDVDQNNTFYASIRCLACRGIVSGYSDGTFRPNNPVTRGQLAKMVSNSAGFNESISGQTFTDVPPSNTFYVWIERLTSRGHMTGYVCGGPGEPCINDRPYFRPFANATRGQTSKIVSNAAGFNEPATGQTFEDVPPTSTFYEFIQRLASRNVMQGYACGGPGEPCVGPENRPYFRPGNDVTRGQSAKIVANTFFPECNPSTRP